MPAGTDVVVVDSYGTVTTSGVRSGTIDAAHGRVDAADVAGDLSVTNSYEDVAVARVGAACRVSSRHADVRVRQARGEVRIDHAYGKVEVSDAAAGATIAGEHTEVSLLRVKGAVDVRTTYESVSLTDVGPATVVGEHTAVAADGIGGALKVVTTYDKRPRQRRPGRSGRRGKERGGRRPLHRGRDDPDRDVLRGPRPRRLHRPGRRQPVPRGRRPGPGRDHLGHRREERLRDGPVRLAEGIRVPFEGRSKGGDVKWGLAARPDLETTNGETLVKAFAGAVEGACGHAVDELRRHRRGRGRTVPGRIAAGPEGPFPGFSLAEGCAPALY